ncbi:hypothetical protein [Acholeplasma laidlawii]|uniref:hypothetical protein n=1 Tax=Acholeplasma laidlawii TaxID=2148 RepID=UPI002540EAAA|nr:hypothetical protein QOL21_04175 [Acholeplasma laidlawii]
MIFWTLLLAALFTMGLLYVICGPRKIWITLSTYAILSVVAILLIYYQFKGLYTLDLIALGLPYLFLIPLHFTVNSMIKHYVLHDDARTSLFFVAIFNRILIASWGVFIILLIGAGLAVLDGLLSAFDAENIWSISVTGVLALVVLSAIIGLGYKKKFTYVLVVGKNTKHVYELHTSRSRLIAKKYTGVDRVYPRGFYQEHGKMKYLYYIQDDIKMTESPFKPIDSDLFNYLKDYIDSYESLEEAYTEYIEQKSSI